MTEDNRNLLIFGVCAAVLFVIYQVWVVEPANKRRQAELKRFPK